MRRYLLIAVGVALFLILAIANQPLKAQIYGQYDTIKVVQLSNPIGYVPLSGANIIPNGGFKKPSAPNLPPTIPDRDNGYYEVPVGFSFEFNGEVYDHVWICVNGFITFSQPVYVPATNPLGLFDFGSSYQPNVIAPYWGDHYLVIPADTLGEGTDRHIPSEISFKTEGTSPNRIFTVQWKNLYINLQTPLLPGQLPPLKNGIGNFQVKLYECPDPYSKQGDIEFCYGQVEGNPLTTQDQVITKGASIGIKGETNVRGSFADFMNGLFYVKAWDPTDWINYNPDSVRTSLKLTNDWAPSGGNDKRIHYYAIARFQSEYWGDGDADMSKLAGRKHGIYGSDQSRYVTFNDARVVMRSVVTSKQLDSVLLRSAYHGDVNHNGRYFYRDTGVLRSKVNPANDSLDPYTGDPVHGLQKTAIPWTNAYYGDSLSYVVIKDHLGRDSIVPTQINTLKMVFFQVTEYDAAIMLDYMAGRMESLPYLIDTVPTHGKITEKEELATNIIAGAAERIGNNTYMIPVYINGAVNGPLSMRFSIDGKVTGVTTDNSGAISMLNDFSDNEVVVAGTGNFKSGLPVCVITVESAKSDLTVSNIRFNDVETGRQSIYLANTEDANNGELMLNNQPNPFYGKTQITMNIKDAGQYRLEVYDALGNKVKTLFDQSLNSGPYSIDWNGTDDSGNLLGNGTYIYRLTGQNASLSNKLLLFR